VGMNKTINPAGWDFGEPIVQFVKKSSRGIIGYDRQLLIKRAGHAFTDQIEKIAFHSDEEPVHVLAFGTTDIWGPNRNGDGFSKNWSRKNHQTFEKFAKWYRMHKNKDPNLSYGRIIKSAFNEEMSRVELICGLNKTKSAAERNGGFVADKEMDKLASGDDIPVSMSCRVPYDICSICGNKSKTRKDYCKSASCAGGGCADNLGKLVKVGNDNRILYVDNYDPVWFDISNVLKPADRTAYGNKADYLLKAAEDRSFIMGGAKLAEELGICAPLDVIIENAISNSVDPEVQNMVKIAFGLSYLETAPLNPEDYRSFDSRVQTRFNVNSLPRPDEKQANVALTSLASHGIILPFRDFANWKGKEACTRQAAECLPSIYSKLVNEDSIAERINTSSYRLKNGNETFDKMACSLINRFGLDNHSVSQRWTVSKIREYDSPSVALGNSELTKSGFDISEAESLATEYALYKLAALNVMVKEQDETEFFQSAVLSVSQNRVI